MEKHKKDERKYKLYKGKENQKRKKE